jgi:hypothetical protein
MIANCQIQIAVALLIEQYIVRCVFFQLDSAGSPVRRV